MENYTKSKKSLVVQGYSGGMYGCSILSVKLYKNNTKAKLL
jgi:hypothetical protein